MAWYDLLTTLGNYHGGTLQLRGLGVTLQYEPGTMVWIAGRMVQCGVPEVDGERVCRAHWMRDKVMEKLGIEDNSWMNKNVYGK